MYVPSVRVSSDEITDILTASHCRTAIAAAPGARERAE
jgi:hypothetical protein